MREVRKVKLEVTAMSEVDVDSDLHRIYCASKQDTYVPLGSSDSYEIDIPDRYVLPTVLYSGKQERTSPAHV
jgi:hypothetical protein